MAAGISDRLWSVEDIANLVETAAPKPGKRSLQASRRRNFKLRHYRRLTRIASQLLAAVQDVVAAWTEIILSGRTSRRDPGALPPHALAPARA